MYSKPGPEPVRASYERTGSYYKKRSIPRKKLSSMPRSAHNSILVTEDNTLTSFIQNVLKKWVKSMYPVTEKDRRISVRMPSKKSSLLSGYETLNTPSSLYFEAERHRKPSKTSRSTQLTELEVIAIATVFEDVYPIFGILETSVVDEDDDSLRVLSYRTPTERFYRQPFDLPLIAGRNQMYDDDAKEARRRECVKMTRILNEIVKELLKKGSYTILQHAALIPHLIEREEQTLLNEYKENLRKIKLLRETIKNFRVVSAAESRTHSSQRSKAKGYCRRLLYYNGLENEYMDKWIDSRKFQNTYGLKRTEVKMENDLEEVNEKIKDTIYAHDNVMMYYRTDFNNILNKIDQFDKRHEKDKEAVELVSETLKIQIKSTQYLRAKAQKAYERLFEKNTWIRERRRRIIEEERLYRRQVQAVKKIERWWRSIYAKLQEQKKKKKKGKVKGKRGKK